MHTTYACYYLLFPTLGIRIGVPSVGTLVRVPSVGTPIRVLRVETTTCLPIKRLHPSFLTLP